MKHDNCELCSQSGGEVIWQGDKWRVVLANEAAYPGFCRVIWNDHVAEMTDLLPSDRAQLMEAVWQVEFAMREVMQPKKVNLASLGNMVPHLHWHVIPRYEDDAQFPAPVWAAAKRTTPSDALTQRVALLPALYAEIGKRMKERAE